jgi:hypothetical protein
LDWRKEKRYAWRHVLDVKHVVVVHDLLTLAIHAAGNGPTVVAKIDVPIIDFIDDAEGKLVHTDVLIEIATKHLGSPHHRERTVTFFTQTITIGFGSIRYSGILIYNVEIGINLTPYI